MDWQAERQSTGGTSTNYRDEVHGSTQSRWGEHSSYGSNLPSTTSSYQRPPPSEYEAPHDHSTYRPEAPSISSTSRAPPSSHFASQNWSASDRQSDPYARSEPPAPRDYRADYYGQPPAPPPGAYRPPPPPNASERPPPPSYNPYDRRPPPPNSYERFPKGSYAPQVDPYAGASVPYGNDNRPPGQDYQTNQNRRDWGDQRRDETNSQPQRGEWNRGASSNDRGWGNQRGGYESSRDGRY
ncbi:hypothetical protein P7C70_g3953, partial [Phenoliferia sp. Uapishka_3]